MRNSIQLTLLSKKTMALTHSVRKTILKAETAHRKLDDIEQVDFNLDSGV